MNFCFKATLTLAAALLLAAVTPKTAFADSRVVKTGISHATDSDAEYEAPAECEAFPEEEFTATEEEIQRNAEQELRQEVVDYALTFVGGRYVWGGEDPHTGADCSGFTRYVLRETAGVSLPHSAKIQSTEGRDITAEEMRPGDLLFYSEGGAVNHVAMYIGDGQIVHASTAKTGIKVSPWNYREPVRIRSFLG